MGTICPHCNKGLTVTLGKPADVAPVATPDIFETLTKAIVMGFKPLARPNGLAEIRRAFGEPGNVVLGRADVPAVFRRLEYAKNGYITVHSLLVDRVEWIFAEIERQGIAHLVEDYGGCYNDRPKRKGGDKSTHAWAIALDLNVDKNPMGGPDHQDPRITAIFEAAGFCHLPGDYMHYQFCTGY